MPIHPGSGQQEGPEESARVTLPLPEGALAMLRTLTRAGFEAWVVGGFVRDVLAGRTPGDVDIATSALPAQVRALFEKTVPTGARFGTVTVFLQGAQAEVTTFRREHGTVDARHPAAVAFDASLREDLSRRDFTVNAMAWHPDKGLFDPFGGRADLQNRLVRAVGEPARRFEEDALRILRAWRLAAQLGFALEPGTRAAAVAAMPLVAALSGERVREEWQKLLCADFAAAFAPELAGVWRALGTPTVPCAPPQRQGSLPGQGALRGQGALPVPDALSGRNALPADPAARWAAFFFLAQVDAARARARLRFSCALAGEVRALLAVLAAPRPTGPANLRRLLAKLDAPTLDTGLLLRAACLGEDAAPARAWLAGILSRGEACRVEQLALRGGELAAMGFAGPACGRAQRALLSHVLARPQDNTAAALRALLESPALQALRRPSGRV